MNDSVRAMVKVGRNGIEPPTLRVAAKTGSTLSFSLVVQPLRRILLLVANDVHSLLSLQSVEPPQGRLSATDCRDSD